MLPAGLAVLATAAGAPEERSDGLCGAVARASNAREVLARSRARTLEGAKRLPEDERANASESAGEGVARLQCLAD